MHELTLANNILKIIEEHAARQTNGYALEVELIIGELSGVMPEALKGALQAVLRGTKYASTAIHFTEMKALAQCTQCGREISMDGFYAECPKCHHTLFGIIQGKELFVKSITFDEMPAS